MIHIGDSMGGTPFLSALSSIQRWPGRRMRFRLLSHDLSCRRGILRPLHFLLPAPWLSRWRLAGSIWVCCHPLRLPPLPRFPSESDYPCWLLLDWPLLSGRTMHRMGSLINLTFSHHSSHGKGVARPKIRQENQHLDRCRHTGRRRPSSTYLRLAIAQARCCKRARRRRAWPTVVSGVNRALFGRYAGAHASWVG